MTTRKLLKTACLALVMTAVAACQADDTATAAGGNGAAGGGQAAMAADTVGLTLRVGVTRAGGDDHYFHNEYTVSSLDAFFFDADSRQLVTTAHVADLTQADDLHDARYDITYVFRNVRVKVGRFDILMVANFPRQLDGIETEQQLLDAIDGETYHSGIEPSLPETGPVMTSDPGAFLNVDLSPYGGRDYVMQVEMERCVSKLQIGVAANSFWLEHDGQRYAELHVTNYKLVNMSRAYYLFPHTEGDYVCDPLFDRKTTEPAAVGAWGEQCASWYGAFATDDLAAMPAAGNYGLAYVLENTAPAGSQKQGYAPGVVLKASVSPMFLYLYDQQSRTLQEERRPEFWPETIYLWRYNFYGSIQALNTASGMTLDELAQYDDAALAAMGVKQSHFNQGAYETYYTYWIEHRDAGNDPMGPMRYAVVRNHYYRMTVTRVTGLGYSRIAPDTGRDCWPNSFEDVVVQ